MAEHNLFHNIVLEEKEKLSVSGVTDVDTFDEEKIVLFIPDDTLIIEGEDLHIKKFDILTGELSIEGDVYSIMYTGSSDSKGSKGFFKRMLK